MKIIVVKTWAENNNVSEAIGYLEYNELGSVSNITGTNMYLCVLGDNEPKIPSDVTVVSTHYME